MAISALLLLLGVAVASGLVGCFAVMRRMTLVADALSHVALPGIGLALAFHFNPLLGALGMLFAGTWLIWAVESRTHLNTETIVGVVFTLSLAVGTMITPGEELIDALFGGLRAPGPLELAFALLGAACVATFILAKKDALILALVSPELAMTSGVKVSRLNLAFLMVFALTVSLGLRFMGVLLMGSLIIIPAATARRLARGLNGMLAVCVGVAVFSALAGVALASRLGHETGPMIVLVAGCCFLLSLAKPRRA